MEDLSEYFLTEHEREILGNVKVTSYQQCPGCGSNTVYTAGGFCCPACGLISQIGDILGGEVVVSEPSKVILW